MDEVESNMTKDKSLKNKITDAMWLVPFAILPAIANASENGGLEPSTLWTGIVVAWLMAAGLTANNAKTGLTFVGILGAGVSLYLATQHYTDGPALCDAGEVYSCSTVNTSEYSEIAGFPIALLGFGHFAVMMILANLKNDNKKEYASAGALLFASSIGAVLYSAVLGYLSAVQIGAWCLFCISLYGLNAIGLFGAWKLKSGNDTGMLEGKSLSTAVSGFLGAALVAYFVIVPSDSSTTTNKEGGIMITDIVEEALELPLDGTEPVMGNRNAGVQLVEFADFECPHCASVAPQLKELLSSNNNVNLRFKHYPISNICNPNIGREGHANACLAAIATDCALKQGKFWEMNSIVFKNQNYLSRKDVEFLAEAQVKLEMTSFKACLDDPTMLDGIRSDIAAADAVGVQGTPSVYIKGVANKEKWYRLTGTVQQLQVALAAYTSESTTSLE